MNISTLMTFFVNSFVIIFFPFVFTGIINYEKAWWAGRSSNRRILQPWHDFLRLLKKSYLYSRVVSPVFSLSPLVSTASLFAAGLLVPMIRGKSVFSFSGDLILFAFLLSCGKFFSLISALDTGSSFEGMGASREITFTAIIEPAFFLLFASLAVYTGESSFSGIISHLKPLSHPDYFFNLLSSAALFIMLLTEGGRVPVDDPCTHLELTMIHEVMILDNSASDLALLSITPGIRMVLISSLIANILMPVNAGFILSAAIFCGIILSCALITALLEFTVARLRMSHVPQFIYFMNFLTLILLFTIAFNGFGGQ